MSTTQSAVVSSSTATSPPSVPGSDASTLLFGFLVSALSLFAVFMTSAIVWNRLIARRHAIDAMLAVNPPELSRLLRPKMWEIWIVPDEEPTIRSDMKPVAARQCDRSSSSRITQTEQTTSFWRHHIFNRLPPEITYVFYRPIPPACFASDNTDMSRVDLSHGSDVQYSLLIAMPHAPRAGIQENYEMVFATTNALYQDFVS